MTDENGTNGTGPLLYTPRLEVVLDDGRTLTVQALNPDLVRFDRTAAKHGWPNASSAPFLWLSFLAWAALRRTGAIDEAMTWDKFVDTHALQVRNLTEADGVPAQAVDPTPSVPGPG